MDLEAEITPDDSWVVITAYFDQKGLVRQQLDSYDDFVSYTMQDIVSESKAIELYPQVGSDSEAAVILFFPSLGSTTYRLDQDRRRGCDRSAACGRASEVVRGCVEHIGALRGSK